MIAANGVAVLVSFQFMPSPTSPKITAIINDDISKTKTQVLGF